MEMNFINKRESKEWDFGDPHDDHIIQCQHNDGHQDDTHTCKFVQEFDTMRWIADRDIDTFVEKEWNVHVPDSI